MCYGKEIPCAEVVRVVRRACAFWVVRRVVRLGCAHRVVRSCARSVGWLCAGIVRSVVRNGCALVVRTQGANPCAHRTAQGFCIVQAKAFRAGQGFALCAFFHSFFSIVAIFDLRFGFYMKFPTQKSFRFVRACGRAARARSIAVT